MISQLTGNVFISQYPIRTLVKKCYLVSLMMQTEIHTKLITENPMNYIQTAQKLYLNFKATTYNSCPLEFRPPAQSYCQAYLYSLR